MRAMPDDDFLPDFDTDPTIDPPRAAPRLTWLADRGAVLALGCVAGFMVGLAYRPAPAPPPRAAPFAGPSAPAASPIAPTAVPAASEATPDPRAVARVRAANGMFRIGVFGDSFGNGVWDALYHQLPRSRGYDVLRFSKEATGFTRYRQLDIEERAKAQLAAQPIDAAVISFGANDNQPLFAEGHLHPLMSAGWQRIVGARIAQFVATVRSTGAIVYWIGLPVMRDPVMDAQMQAMDGFYEQQMARLGVTFVDSRPMSLDPAGRYSAYLPDAAGVPRLMRTGDGVHMIGVGYQRLTAGTAERIARYAGRVRAAAGVSTPGPAPASPAREGR